MLNVLFLRQTFFLSVEETEEKLLAGETLAEIQESPSTPTSI